MEIVFRKKKWDGPLLRIHFCGKRVQKKKVGGSLFGIYFHGNIKGKVSEKVESSFVRDSVTWK